MQGCGCARRAAASESPNSQEDQHLEPFFRAGPGKTGKGGYGSENYLREYLIGQKPDHEIFAPRKADRQSPNRKRILYSYLQARASSQLTATRPHTRDGGDFTMCAEKVTEEKEEPEEPQNPSATAMFLRSFESSPGAGSSAQAPEATRASDPGEPAVWPSARAASQTPAEPSPATRGP